MDVNNIKNLIFIDCEATGKCPSIGKLTEFGAVAYPSKATFHGVIIEGHRSAEDPTTRVYTGKVFDEKEVFEKFEKWLHEITVQISGYWPRQRKKALNRLGKAYTGQFRG